MQDDNRTLKPRLCQEHANAIFDRLFKGRPCRICELHEAVGLLEYLPFEASMFQEDGYLFGCCQTCQAKPNITSIVEAKILLAEAELEGHEKKIQ